VHQVFAAEISSYNKSLLLGGIKYDFVRPVSMDFHPSTGIGGPQILPVTISAGTITETFNDKGTVVWDVSIAWSNPADIQSLSLEVQESFVLWKGFPNEVSQFNGFVLIQGLGLNLQSPPPTSFSFSHGLKSVLYLPPLFISTPYEITFRFKITANYTNQKTESCYKDIVYTGTVNH
jgi:hypothetical protein